MSPLAAASRRGQGGRLAGSEQGLVTRGLERELSGQALEHLARNGDLHVREFGEHTSDDVLDRPGAGSVGLPSLVSELKASAAAIFWIRLAMHETGTDQAREDARQGAWMNVKDVGDLASRGVRKSADDTDCQSLRSGKSDATLHPLRRPAKSVIHGPQGTHEAEHVTQVIVSAGLCLHGPFGSPSVARRKQARRRR